MAGRLRFTLDMNLPGPGEGPCFGYEYTDAPPVSEAVQDFFTYRENEEIAEAQSVFEAEWPKGSWTAASDARKGEYIQCLLDGLDSALEMRRDEAGMKLLYIALGVICDSESAQEHELSICRCCQLLYNAGALSVFMEAFVLACR